MKKNGADRTVRLNKYISDAGYCSRREADRLIEAGRVSVNGQIATMGQKLLSGQRVSIDGQPLAQEKELVLLAVNKPAGIVCTTDKRWGETTIYDLLNYPKRIFSIGRLDKESEGLLLMTNYGDISNEILRAGNYHEKEYLVTVNREVTPAFLKKMSQGIFLEELNVTTRPCKVFLAGKNRFRIILTQGLNRQIRRMCESCGYKVTKLVRVRVMNIELGSLKPGEYRPVNRKEYACLMEMLHNPKKPGKKSDVVKKAMLGNESDIVKREVPGKKSDVAKRKMSEISKEEKRSAGEKQRQRERKR
ncbi:MAG: pseudouridine synthase [Lachnospiraceae bacterium]|nr:pseudouridine synthase [Lachnospiraceae bacterium]